MARDCHRPEAEGFPDFDALSLTRFRVRLPFESQLLYQLSYRPVFAGKIIRGEGAMSNDEGERGGRIYVSSRCFAFEF